MQRAALQGLGVQGFGVSGFQGFRVFGVSACLEFQGFRVSGFLGLSVEALKSKTGPACLREQKKTGVRP